MIGMNLRLQVGTSTHEKCPIVKEWTGEGEKKRIEGPCSFK